MDSSLYFEISDWVSDGMVLLGSIAFFYTFARIKQKNYSLYIILALNISNFILALVNPFVRFIVKNYADAVIVTCTTSALYQFGLYCSTALSIFIYKAIQSRVDFNPLKFLGISLTICGLISCLEIAR